MDRKEEVLKLLKEKGEKLVLIERLVEEMTFLEEKLAYLKTLPFIKIHPKNTQQQKSTAAAKQYKELLQQYINIIKAMEKGKDEGKDGKDSPLRIYMKKRIKEREEKR